MVGDAGSGLLWEKHLRKSVPLSRARILVETWLRLAWTRSGSGLGGVRSNWVRWQVRACCKTHWDHKLRQFVIPKCPLVGGSFVDAMAMYVRIYINPPRPNPLSHFFFTLQEEHSKSIEAEQRRANDAETRLRSQAEVRPSSEVSMCDIVRTYYHEQCLQ